MDQEDLEPLTVETHHVDNRWNKYVIRYKRWIFVLCIVTVVLTVVSAGAIATVIGVSVAHKSSEDSSSPNRNASSTEPPTTQSPSASTSPPLIPYAKLRSLATAVRSNMDTFANPCEDFFQYSCGGWLRQNPLRSGMHQLNRFLQVAISNIKSLRDSIERGDDRNIPAVRLAKRFYDSCMNTGAINGRGARPLLDLVRQTGGWGAINVRNGMCNKLRALLVEEILLHIILYQ